MKYDACEGEANDPGKKNGKVGISSNTSRIVSYLSPPRLRSFHIHRPVYPRCQRKYLVPSAFQNGLRVVRTSAVPDTSCIVSGDDLYEAAGLADRFQRFCCQEGGCHTTRFTVSSSSHSTMPIRRLGSPCLSRSRIQACAETRGIRCAAFEISRSYISFN